MVMVFGEITTTAKVDYEKVVRDTCREIGFTHEDVGLNADTCKVRCRRSKDVLGSSRVSGFVASLTQNKVLGSSPCLKAVAYVLLYILIQHLLLEP
jgi:hypothetical protein